MLLALAMRFGFPGLGSAANTALGAAAKSAVSVYTGPAPSFVPKAIPHPPPLAEPVAPPATAEPVAALVAEPAIVELLPIGGGAPAPSGTPAALEEVSAPEPSIPAPSIMPSCGQQEVEVEVLC